MKGGLGRVGIPRPPYSVHICSLPYLVKVVLQLPERVVDVIREDHCVYRGTNVRALGSHANARIKHVENLPDKVFRPGELVARRGGEVKDMLEGALVTEWVIVWRGMRWWGEEQEGGVGGHDSGR